MEYRPAEYQINNVYRCTSCGSEIEVPCDQIATRCTCGGDYDYAGESYPGDSSEWDEERSSCDGQWHPRR